MNKEINSKVIAEVALALQEQYESMVFVGGAVTVSQIEKEQELVNANKQLIEIFEQKEDRIA